MHARIYAAEIDLSVLTRWRPSIFIMHPPCNTVPKVHARFPRKQHLDRLISRDEHTQRASETTPLQVLVLCVPNASMRPNNRTARQPLQNNREASKFNRYNSIPTDH